MRSYAKFVYNIRLKKHVARYLYPDVVIRVEIGKKRTCFSCGKFLLPKRDACSAPIPAMHKCTNAEMHRGKMKDTARAARVLSQSSIVYRGIGYMENYQ